MKLPFTPGETIRLLDKVRAEHRVREGTARDHAMSGITDGFTDGFDAAMSAVEAKLATLADPELASIRAYQEHQRAELMRAQLRDQFAMAVVCGSVSLSITPFDSAADLRIAQRIYQFADAMIEARSVCAKCGEVHAANKWCASR